MTQNTPPAAPEGNFDVRDLIAGARVDISDADRCIMLGVTPAVHQLHRRLRMVTNALEAEAVRPHGTATPPADDVREAMHAAVSDVLADAFSDAVTERIAADILTRMSVTHEVRPRGTVAEADDDDVREMLAQTICVSVRHMHGGNECDSDYTTADAILAALDVRPRGKVTDAEVETVLQALGHSRSGVTTSRMRAALEAAREVR